MKIVPSFNKGKYCLASLNRRMEDFPVQQFTLQCGKETLAHCVIETVADRTHGGTYASFSAALPKSQRGVLAALIGVVNDILRTALPDRHSQRIQYQLGAQMGGHCPTNHGKKGTFFRLQASITTARYSQPVQVET